MEKLRVALISVGAALFLITAKAVVGFLTGSLAILAEAVHSGLDLFASLVTALSVKAADRPPDRTHHYGHGKIESLSALFEATLLFLTCIWIFHEALQRLTGAGAAPRITVYSFGVMILAIVIDYSRYRVLMRTAKKHHSQALEADAIHFYSDILSSSLVLIGLIAVSMGYPWADALAAMAVALWVGILSVRLAKKNLNILIDRVPEEYLEKIRSLVLSVPGVLKIDQLRLRRSGSYLFADLRIGMDRTLSFDEAHRLAGELEEKLSGEIQGLDTVVHMDPAISPRESLDMGILHFIHSEGFQAHHVALRQVDDKYNLELHLEVRGDSTIGRAHREATELETKLLRKFPSLQSVRTHIEELDSADFEELPWHDERPDIVEKIRKISAEAVGEEQCHAITLSHFAGLIGATMHCLFPGSLTVAEVHQMTTRLEERLLHSIPELDRVLIHAEPLPDKTDETSA